MTVKELKENLKNIGFDKLDDDVELIAGIDEEGFNYDEFVIEIKQIVCIGKKEVVSCQELALRLARKYLMKFIYRSLKIMILDLMYSMAERRFGKIGVCISKDDI